MFLLRSTITTESNPNGTTRTAVQENGTSVYTGVQQKFRIKSHVYSAAAGTAVFCFDFEYSIRQQYSSRCKLEREDVGIQIAILAEETQVNTPKLRFRKMASLPPSLLCRLLYHMVVVALGVEGKCFRESACSSTTTTHRVFFANFPVSLAGDSSIIAGSGIGPAFLFKAAERIRNLHVCM